MTADQFNTCVDAHSDALFRFAMKNLKDRDEAMEIVQSSFEKLWIKRNDVDNDRVKSYLFTTAYNAMVDFWRRSKKNIEMTEEIHDKPAENQTEYRGLKQILDQALSKIPEIQRTVILLRDYEGYSYEEIGEITNLNESQVKVYIFRARQTLKGMLGNLEAII
jgi:RNA polymerase sigma factor (sigma-70 family)